jgi:hypothetical protein
MSVIVARRQAVANVVVGVAAAMQIGLVPLLVIGASRNVDLAIDSNSVGGIVLAVAYTLVGWIIIRRQPQNPLGWVFLGVGFFESLSVFTAAYAADAYAIGGGSWPLADLASWVQVWAWMPGFVLFTTFSILLFPDGRLPSPRWAGAAWLAVVGLALGLPLAIASWPYRGAPIMSANHEIPTGDSFIVAAANIQSAGGVLLTAAAVLCVAGMVARFRRSTGTVRQQLKWFTWAATVEIVLILVWESLPVDQVTGIAVALVLTPILPIVTTLAILRYRLFDIDRIVSRTVAWAIVTTVLVAIFAAVNLGLTAALASVTQAGTFAIAASTLVAFALFQPIRRRIQGLVDRRFDRARVDADRSVALLAERLRAAVELDAIRDDVLGTVDATVRPTSAAIWLRRNESRTQEA